MSLRMSGCSVSLNETREVAARAYPQYTCAECSLLLKDAVQTNCGHLLCETCAEHIFVQSNRDARCPKKDCSETLLGEDGTKYFPDRRLRKEIRSLSLTCHIDGCFWKGVLNDYEVHYNNKHPPSNSQVVPKRKATHTLVEIKHPEVTSTASQVMRNSAADLKQTAAVLEKEANKLDEHRRSATYVQCGTVDSMPTLESASGGARSTFSLGRACQQFPEEKSSTLKAQGSDQVHVKFEIPSDIEHTKPIPQNAQQTQPEMVTGSVRPTILSRPQPIVLSPLPSPVMEQSQTLSPGHKSASGSSLPPLISHSNGQIHVPSTTCTSAPSASPQRRLRKQSPRTPLSPLPSISHPRQFHSRSPLEQLPAAGNRTPRGKSAANKRPSKANTLPQLEVGCPACREKDEKLKKVKGLFSKAMNDGVMKCTNCQKENRRNSV